MAELDWLRDPKEVEARRQTEIKRRQRMPDGTVGPDHGIFDRMGPLTTIPALFGGALDVAGEAVGRRAAADKELSRLLEIKNNNPETARFLDYLRSLGDQFTYQPQGSVRSKIFGDPRISRFSGDLSPAPVPSEREMMGLPPLRGEEAIRQLIQDEQEHFLNAQPDMPQAYTDLGVSKLQARIPYDGPTWRFEQHPFYRAMPQYWDTMERKYGRSEQGNNLDQRIQAGEFTDPNTGQPDWNKIMGAKDIASSYTNYRKSFDDLNKNRQLHSFPVEDSDGNPIPFLRDYKGYIDHWKILKAKDQKLYKDWWDDLWVMGEGGIHFALAILGNPSKQPGQSNWDAAWQMGGSMTGGLAGALAAGFSQDPDYYMKTVRKPVVLGALFAPTMFKLTSALVKGTLTKAQQIRVGTFMENNPGFAKALQRTAEAGAAIGDWAPVRISVQNAMPVIQAVGEAAAPIAQAAGQAAQAARVPAAIAGEAASAIARTVDPVTGPIARGIQRVAETPVGGLIREEGRTGRDYALRGKDVPDPQGTVVTPEIIRQPGRLEPRRIRDVVRKSVKDTAHLFWTGIPTHGLAGAAIGIGIPIAARYFYGLGVSKSKRLRTFNNEMYKAFTRRSQGQAESAAMGLETQRDKRNVAEGMQSAKEGAARAEAELARQEDPSFVPDPESLQEAVPYAAREQTAQIPFAETEGPTSVLMDEIVFTVTDDHPLYREPNKPPTPEPEPGMHQPRKGYRIVKEPQRWNNETQSWEGGEIKSVNQYPRSVDPYEPLPRAEPELGRETLNLENGTVEAATPDQVKMDNRREFAAAVREAANDIHLELESVPGALSMEATQRTGGQRMSRAGVEAERARDQAQIAMLRKAEEIVLDRLNPENLAKDTSGEGLTRRYNDAIERGVEDLSSQGETLATADVDMPTYSDGDTAGYRPPVTEATASGVDYAATGLMYFINVLEQAAENLLPQIELRNLERQNRTLRIVEKEIGSKAFREVMERVNRNIYEVISNTGEIIIGSPLWEQLTGSRKFGLETDLTASTRSPRYEAKGTGVDSISGKPETTRVPTMRKPGKEGEIAFEQEVYGIGDPETLGKPRANEAKREASRKKYMEMPMEELVKEANKRGLQYDETLSIVPSVRPMDGVLVVKPRDRTASIDPAGPEARAAIPAGIDRGVPATRKWVLTVEPKQRATGDGISAPLEKPGKTKVSVRFETERGEAAPRRAARSRADVKSAPVERKRLETAVRRELVEKLTEMDVKGYKTHPGVEQGLFGPEVTVESLKTLAERENISLKGVRKKEDIANRILERRKARLRGKPDRSRDWSDEAGTAGKLARKQQFDRAALDAMSDADVRSELNQRGVKLPKEYDDPVVFKEGGTSAAKTSKFDAKGLRKELDALPNKQAIYEWVAARNRARKADPESPAVTEMAEAQGVTPEAVAERGAQRQIKIRKRDKREDLIRNIIEQERKNTTEVTTAEKLPPARVLLDKARRAGKESVDRAQHSFEGSVQQQRAKRTRDSLRRRFEKPAKDSELGDPRGLDAASKLDDYLAANGELSPKVVEGINQAVVDAGFKNPELMSFKQEKRTPAAEAKPEAKPAKKKRTWSVRSSQAAIKSIDQKLKKRGLSAKEKARLKAMRSRLAARAGVTKFTKKRPSKKYKTKAKDTTDQGRYRDFDKRIGQLSKQHIASRKARGPGKGREAQELASEIVSANLPLDLQRKLISRIRKEIMESAGIQRPMGRKGTPVEELQAIEDGTLVVEMLGHGKSSSIKKWLASKVQPILNDFKRQVDIANENIKRLQDKEKSGQLTAEDRAAYNRNVKDRAQALDEQARVLSEILAQFFEGVVKTEWAENYTPDTRRGWADRGTARNIPGTSRSADLQRQIQSRMRQLPKLVIDALKKGRKLPEDLAAAVKKSAERQELLDAMDLKDPTGKLRRDYIANERNIRLSQSLELPGIWNESTNGNPLYNLWQRIAQNERAAAIEFMTSQIKKALDDAVATAGTEANFLFKSAESALRTKRDLSSLKGNFRKRFKREFYLIRDAINKGGVTSFNKARRRLAESDLNQSEQYALNKILDIQEAKQLEKVQGVEVQIGDVNITPEDMSYLDQRLINSGALYSEPGKPLQRGPLIMNLDKGWSKEYLQYVRDFVKDMERQGKSLGEQRSWTAALMKIWNNKGGHGLLLDDGFRMRVVEHVVEKAKRDYNRRHPNQQLPDAEIARLKLSAYNWLKSNEMPFRAKPMAAPHSRAKAPTTDKMSVEGGLALADVPRYFEFFYEGSMELPGGRFKLTYDLFDVVPETFKNMTGKERKAAHLNAFRNFHAQYASGVKLSNLAKIHAGYLAMVDVSYGDTIPQAATKIAFYNIFDGTPIKSLPNRLLRYMKEFYNKELDRMEMRDNYFETVNKETGASSTRAEVLPVTNKDLTSWMRGDLTYAAKELNRLYRTRMESQIANKHKLKPDEMYKIPQLKDAEGKPYKLELSEAELNQIFGKGWRKDNRAKVGSIWMKIADSMDQFSSFFDRPKMPEDQIQGLWNGTYFDGKWKDSFDTLRLAIENANREMLGGKEPLGPQRSVFDNLDPEGFRTYSGWGEAGVREALLDQVNPTGKTDLSGNPIYEGAKAPQELIPDVVNDIQWHPEIRQGMAWDAQLTKDMARLGAALQSMVKGGITVKSLLTQGGNIIGNFIAISLTTGESVPAIAFRILASHQLFKEYRKNPVWYRENMGSFSPETQRYLRAVDAIDRFTGIELMDMVTVETQGRGLTEFLDTTRLGDKKTWTKMKESTAWKLAEGYEKLWQDMYQRGDNWPRKAEVLREAMEGFSILEKLKPGEKISFQTSQRGDTTLYRDDKGIYRITKHRKKQYPSKEDPFVDKAIASWAARRTFGRIFNYRNVPRVVEAARVGKLGGLSALVNPFISFPALATDIIGAKKGIIANTILDSALRTDIRTNSPSANAAMGRAMAGRALRQYAYLNAVQSFAYPHAEDLALIGRSQNQRGAPSLLARESNAYNEVRLLSWRNGNPMEMSRVVHDNLFAFEALLAEKMINWLDTFDAAKQEKIDKYRQTVNVDPVSGKALLPGAGGGFDDIPGSTNAMVDYFMGKVNSGEVLTGSDLLNISQLTGGFVASVWRDMSDAKSATDKGLILLSKTPQLFLGVNNTQLAKTFLTRGAFGKEGLIDPGSYISPYRNQIDADDKLVEGQRRGDWVLSVNEEPYLGGKTFADRSASGNYDDQLKYLDTFTGLVIARTSARRAMLLDEQQMNPYIKAVQKGLRSNLIDNREYKDPVKKEATRVANELSESRINHIVNVLKDHHSSIRTDLDQRRKLKLDIPFFHNRGFEEQFMRERIRADKMQRQMGRMKRQRKRDYDKAAREEAARIQKEREK